MENYIVSARKYRPNTFDSVVGQHSITSTLKNAIKNNHLAQAFLFCGPRGVGKTTCARILAKTINCFSITENIEACNECESCKSFDEGRSLNIHELDGASNNGVDEIRNLIDQVRFAPQIGTHKVYIIDEVHMLSQAAFNAFLKTLEEPPKHAIFILATTEKHKIIPTILSRCQIFDFNRILIDDIANHLAKIAQKENVQTEADGLHIIAQKADGALRDALSMFDQIVSFSGGTISYQDVIENLNILDYDYYFKVTDALLSNDVSESLIIFNEILNNGFDGHNFINGLGEHFRNLLVCQDPRTIDLIEVGATIKEKYLQQAQATDTNQLINFLTITNKVDTQYKGSKNQRLLIEVMLMQLCASEQTTSEKKKPIINIPIGKSIISPKTEISNKVPETITKPEREVIAPMEEETLAVTPLDETNSITKKVEENIPLESKPIVEEDTVFENEIGSEDTEEGSTNQAVKTSIKKVSNFAFAESISINTSAVKLEKENESAENLISDKPSESFTTEKAIEVLNDFKIKLQEKGKSSLASIFEDAPNIEAENFHFSIENKALEDEFNAQKADFLDFIRNHLSNYNIQVSTEVNKDEQLKKAYTPQEKFIKMSEKNPHLKELVKKLDMDVGYA